MPHQCVKCNAVYVDDATEVIDGCACGAKAFLYIKDITQLDQENLTEEIRDEVLAQEPLMLDVEAVNIKEEGKYELDINSLFGKREVVYKHDDGKYSIDLEESFRRHADKE